MRVLVHFPGPIRGGCEDHALLVIRAATRAGHDVVTCFPFTDGTRSLLQDVRSLGLAATPWPVTQTVNGSIAWGDASRQATAAAAVLEETKPDGLVLFVPEPDASLGVLSTCAVARVPTVAVFCLVPPRWSISVDDRERGAHARRHCQRWVAISEDNRRQLTSAYAITDIDEVTVVLNGVDLPEAWLAPDSTTVNQTRTALREELAVPSSARIALTVARLSRPKGHQDLVAAIRLLPPSLSDVHFVWAGTGEDESHLRSAVGAAGIGHRVHFVGYRDDVGALLWGSDVFVFPTHWEGYARALIEAMSAGLPIVASDAGSNSELLEGGNLAVLFPVADPAGLADRLTYALTNPAHMGEMAVKARRRGRQLSAAQMCGGILGVLDEVTQSAGGQLVSRD